MTVKFWTVEGVHAGKKVSDLPITYLLWLVGSPIMRRTRWIQCQIALREIRRRLSNGVEGVEADLIADLRSRSVQERQAMRERERAYRQRSGLK